MTASAMNTPALRASLLALALGCSATPATNTTDAGRAPADVVAAADVPRVDVPAVTDRGPTLDTAAVQDVAPDAPDPCEGLGELCHEVDPGSGPIHDCHEGGHDGDPLWCAENALRCRALCTPDAAVRDASTDAAQRD
jgi:hypothetical protein